MTIELTAEQQRVIAKLKDIGAKRLIRVSGGFWTFPGCYTQNGVPEWYTHTQTIKAMEKKGLLVRANVYPEAWKDNRILES